MCGIAGSILTDSAESTVNLAVQAMAKRGPDHQEFRTIGEMVLGHARLSILDTSPASHQPFLSEDGRYALTYNGEIYNYREIRRELQLEGIVFRTSGDTEVLLKLLIHEGFGALQKLNGFFAFAFYDRHADELWLVRDRFGIKPLYYTTEGNFCFASELGAITRMTQSGEYDRKAFAIFLQLGYFPAPFTPYRSVKKLLPGELLIRKGNEISLQRWFDTQQLPGVPYSDSNLRNSLEDAVKLRLIADRPVGTFLSGGLDSSIITALASRAQHGIDSFSVSFSNAYLDESEVAGRVAAHLGTKHHVIPFEAISLKDRLDKTCEALSEPFADSSAIAYLALSEYTSSQVKVALSGDGADELFGGYNKHKALAILQNPFLSAVLKHFPTFYSGNRESRSSDLLRKLNRMVSASKLNGTERYWFLASFSEKMRSAALAKASLEDLEAGICSIAGLSGPDTLDEMLRRDQALVLPNDMLFKADSMSMACGLEVRVPFMDHRVVAIANSMSARDRFNARVGKIPLRRVFKDLLPDEVLKKAKHGFEIPLIELVNQIQASELFSEPLIRKADIFEPGQVNSVLSAFRSAPDSGNAFLLYAIYIAQHWALRK